MTDTSSQNSLKALSVRVNIFHSVIGRIYYAFTQFAVIVLTARLGEPQDVGALALATAIVTPLFFLTSMGMRMVHSVDDLVRFDWMDYVALRLFGSLTALLLTIIIVALFYGERNWLIPASIIAFSLLKFASAQQSLNHAMFQRSERLDFVGLSILSRNSLGLLIFAAVFWASRSLPWALLAEATAWALSYRFVDRALLKRIGIEIRLKNVRTVPPRRVGLLALWLLPVGVALMLSRSTLSLPPIILERELGLAAVGIFAALAYTHTAMMMVGSSLSSASAARMRRHLREGRETAFWSLAQRLTLLSAVAGVCATLLAWLVGAPLLNFIFGPEYAQRVLFTTIVASSGVALLGTPLITALTAAHAFYWRLIAAATALLSGLIACLLLIPSYGISGAAWAIMLSQTAHILTILAALWVVFGRRFGAQR